MADNNLTTRTLTLESRDEAVLLFGNRLRPIGWVGIALVTGAVVVLSSH